MVTIKNWGGFSAEFRVKTHDCETEKSHMVDNAGSASWTHEELIGARFKVGDDCWVSCDVAGGKTNSESPGNFFLTEKGGNIGGILYEVHGTTLYPDWSGPFGGDQVTVGADGTLEKKKDASETPAEGGDDAKKDGDGDTKKSDY